MNKKLKYGYFIIISIIGFFAIFSSTMSKSPILPLFANFLISSPEELQYIGYVTAASTIPGIIISIFAGRLSDLYGRKRIILISTIIFASAPFLYVFAINIWILMIIRFYHGFSTAIFVPVATAAIAESYPKKRGTNISLFSSITTVGRILAPIVGTLILTFTDYFYYGVYIACGISGALALIFAFYLHQSRKWNSNEKVETKGQSFTARTFFKGIKDVFKHKLILVTCIVQASQFFAFGVIEFYIILYVEDLNLAVWVIGAIPALLTLMLFVFRPLMGIISDKYGRRLVIILGLILGGNLTLLLPITTEYVWLLIVICGFGIGMAMVLSSTAAYVSDLSKKEDLGAAIGVLSTIMDIGQTVGPIISGYILIFFSFVGVFWMVAIVLLASAIIFLLVE